MLLATYIASRDLKPRSAYQLKKCWEKFAEFLGREPDCADFDDDRINLFLTWYAVDHKPRTVRNHRHTLVGLWRWACAQGLIAQPPKRVKSIKVPANLPEAWTAQQAARLVDAAGKLSGCFRCGLPRRTVMRALWLAAYDSGLRRSDLLNLRREQLSDDGLIVLVMQKTGQAHICRLRPETMEAVRLVMQDDGEFVFRVAGLRQLYEACQECLRIAKLKGGLQKMRRTAATQIERIEPGSAMRFLGHRTPGLAYKSYVDPRQLEDFKPLPPALGT